MTEYQRRKARMYWQSIRGHYRQSHSEAQWQGVCQNPQLFNAAWRRMLQLPPGDMPPPEPFRHL